MLKDLNGDLEVYERERAHVAKLVKGYTELIEATKGKIEAENQRLMKEDQPPDDGTPKE